MIKTLLRLLLCFCVLAWPAAAEQADAITGRWKATSSRGVAHVEITRDGGEFRGAIVWLAEPLFPADEPDGYAGKPKVDRGNPDPALRDRPILGLEILTGLQFDGEDRWEDGHIYAPDEGKSYHCHARLDEDGNLKLRGYVGIPLLGRTVVWTRVDDPAGADR